MRKKKEFKLSECFDKKGVNFTVVKSKKQNIIRFLARILLANTIYTRDFSIFQQKTSF